ncbi:MAG: hypothetical protein Q9215_007623 [Flavoplaca cf. flavocitrina]
MARLDAAEFRSLPGQCVPDALMQLLLRGPTTDDVRMLHTDLMRADHISSIGCYGTIGSLSLEIRLGDSISQRPKMM